MAENFKASFALTDPDSAPASMTLTMSVGDWKRLSSQLGSGSGSSFPAWKVRAAIEQLVGQAAHVFRTDDDLTPSPTSERSA